MSGVKSKAESKKSQDHYQAKTVSQPVSAMETNSSTDENDTMAQVMFTNLLLLGLDVEDMESVYKIPFNKHMFKGYNKTGANAVLHFLFFNLNSTVCGEQFRDCWPIVDKKSEAQFRKSCFNWLVGVKKSETDVQWPILNASSLQFPGGPKFIHILFRLSIHVIKQNRPDPDQQHYLVNPSWISTPDLAAVKVVSIQDNTNLDLQAFMNQMYITNSTHHMWNKYASELVQGIREKSKAQREIEQEKRTVVTRLAENAIKHGCTLPVKRTLNMFDGDKDDTSIKRRQRLQKVKVSWEKVNMFDKALEEARKIVKAILDHSNSTERLEANDFGVRIPGLLLKQCEKEIRQRQIDNVYIGGRLNMVSVLQLWNLCLHLYLEQLEEAELPDVTKEVPALSMQAHKFHSFLKEIQSLREEISSRFIPELEESIDNLRREARVETEDAEHLSHSKLQLTTPTFPSSVNKSRCDATTPTGLFTPNTIKKKDTPTVLSEIMTSIANVTQKTQAVQSSRLAFEQLKTAQRSSPATLSTVKNGKQSRMGKPQRSVVSMPSQRTIKATNRNVHLLESKMSNKSLLSHKESPIDSNQSTLDQMALSVVDSVIESHDSGRLGDVSLNVDQSNVSSYLQSLMSELDQDTSSEANATLEDSFAPFKHGILLDRSPLKAEPKSTLKSPNTSLESSLNKNSVSVLSPLSVSNPAVISFDTSLNMNLTPLMKSPSSTSQSSVASLESLPSRNSFATLKSMHSASKSPAASLDSSLDTRPMSTSFTTSPLESFRIHRRPELKADSVLSTPPPLPSSAWNIQKQVDDLFSQGCEIFEDIDDD